MTSLFSWLRPGRAPNSHLPPPFDTAIFHTEPRPRQIIDHINDSPSDRDRIVAGYIGLNVQWLTILSRIEKRDDGSFLLTLDDRGRMMPPSIRTQVWAVDYPGLEHAVAGDSVWIAGVIEDVLPGGVALTDVYLELVAQPVR